MHFITGGAFNGKRKWVKKEYNRNQEKQWLSAYNGFPLPFTIPENHLVEVVLEGIEVWVKELTMRYDADRCREIWNGCLEAWISWEKERAERKLIVIGTDITKGIVPVKEENRLWRDVTGWAYQDVAAKSDKVDVIWYGLNQTIK
ncbi:bifunctional adenosylcobinamide kinase/adenosylcobinamide-phosphate guanylyltransferase [Neobacillus sp. OS1-2]|uniref:bifunctional adenosylcobinamide kinase/adenosylcobinamide-phosphate guanylyltransferase n=1 Tax=Neobacillus sp. OS1-2 TaxID=3070680 RepID=UPI0027DF7AD9|nr:bifunctional adenosylcobinamide kinase/adenosylcobinamide-phosphate guanylyltransferase [Neobacillus sp. OS1-2]WML39311.1 bifunctional adenosylcobinamide kinase/adenosylcobinamide-phosphate guanylyltransferase [Neobacillus sp. OS1-2]